MFYPLGACEELISRTTRRTGPFFLQSMIISFQLLYGLKVRTAMCDCAGCSLYRGIQPKEQVGLKYSLCSTW